MNKEKESTNEEQIFTSAEEQTLIIFKSNPTSIIHTVPREAFLPRHQRLSKLKNIWLESVTRLINETNGLVDMTVYHDGEEAFGASFDVECTLKERKHD